MNVAQKVASTLRKCEIHLQNVEPGSRIAVLSPFISAQGSTPVYYNEVTTERDVTISLPASLKNQEVLIRVRNAGNAGPSFREFKWITKPGDTVQCVQIRDN